MTEPPKTQTQQGIVAIIEETFKGILENRKGTMSERDLLKELLKIKQFYECVLPGLARSKPSSEVAEYMRAGNLLNAVFGEHMKEHARRAGISRNDYEILTEEVRREFPVNYF